MTETFDMHGHKIMMEQEPTAGVTTAFANSDFVTFSKNDLDNLLSLLHEIVDVRELIDRDDPRCISYERLVDIKSGVNYPTLTSYAKHPLV